MQPSIRKSITRWTRASNRRRFAEELLIALTWVGLGFVVAVGCLRIGDLVIALGWIDGGRWPSKAVQWGFSAWAIGWVGKIAGGRALWRYRKRRTRLRDFARTLDRVHRTSDLLTTALAIENDRVSGDPELAKSVLARARERLHGLGFPVARFREPARTIAGIGIAACLLAWLPTQAEAFSRREAADGEKASAAAVRKAEMPPLPEETLAALERHASELLALAKEPTLARASQEALTRAGQELEGLRAHRERSLSHLAKAEQALTEVTEQAMRDRLFDRETLAALETERLVESITRAIEAGNDEVAAAMAQELKRRLETASPEDLDRVADALEQAMRRVPAQPEGTPAGEPGVGASSSTSASASASTDPGQAPQPSTRERWRADASERAEQLRAGDTNGTQAELERMAEAARRRGGRMSNTLERSLEDVRRARAEQLGRMNGDGSPGEGQREGTAEDGEATGTGAGSPRIANREAASTPGEAGQPGRAPSTKAGPGLPFAPSGRPGPGGGAGDDARGDASESALHDGERVEASLRGAPQGAVRLIQRASEGYRDGQEYRELHDQYSAVAEAAIRQEQIPLTRRDYIRRYFEAVRGP